MDTHIPFSHPLVYYESIRTGLQPGFFLFLSAMLEKQESSVYRILKSQKTITLAKVSSTKEFSSIDLLCCDIESYGLNLYNLKKSKNY